MIINYSPSLDVIVLPRAQENERHSALELEVA